MSTVEVKRNLFPSTIDIPCSIFDILFLMSKVAVLLVQLGTPDAPTPRALRPYLRQFLSDPRVIEVPRLKWFFILNLFVMPFRPRASAAKYERIWDSQTGSPLLHWTRRQTESLQQALPDIP